MTPPEDERALLEQPVEPYVGLTLQEAESLAGSEGRRIRVLISLAGPRCLDLVPSRVNVELDEAGRVVGADAGQVPFHVVDQLTRRGRHPVGSVKETEESQRE